MVITLDRGQLTPAVEFHLPDPTLDAFLQYRSASDITSARAMLHTSVVGRAATSPVARALLGYTALRWGVEQHGGTSEGRLRCPMWTCPTPGSWRASTARATATTTVPASCSRCPCARGSPLFGDGLGLLSTRLPQYLRLMTAGVVPESATLRAGWARLVPVLRTADLKPVSLTLRSDVEVGSSLRSRT